jgi:hypothetical protein
VGCIPFEVQDIPNQWRIAMLSLDRPMRTICWAVTPLLALVAVLTASPTRAGDHLGRKHCKLKYELVQGYILQPPAATSSAAAAAPAATLAASGMASGQASAPASGQASTASLFNTVASTPAAPIQMSSTAAATMAAVPVVYVPVASAPATVQVAAPATTLLQIASVPLVQTATVAAQPAATMTPVQLLIPERKHCLFGFGH